MIETMTLITLSLLFLIYFRPGKTPLLDNPLVINRTGRYQATLAPQTNLAQPFIETIAEQFWSVSEGMLHFQASSPQSHAQNRHGVPSVGADRCIVAALASGFYRTTI
jgi:hypothetical protein